MTQALRLVALDAFGSTCPLVQDVQTVLQELGSHLVFQMGETPFPQRGTASLPSLPAQYHYQDQHGTEVIFLAGQDRPVDCPHTRFPPHAARWWLYPGASQDAYTQAKQTLSRSWTLSWHPTQADDA